MAIDTLVAINPHWASLRAFAGSRREGVGKGAATSSFSKQFSITECVLWRFIRRDRKAGSCSYRLTLFWLNCSNRQKKRPLTVLHNNSSMSTRHPCSTNERHSPQCPPPIPPLSFSIPLTSGFTCQWMKPIMHFSLYFPIYHPCLWPPKLQSKYKFSLKMLTII